MAESEHPAFDKFVATVAALRDPEGGCAWNRAQTHESLGDYLIEEAYEALDSIEEEAAGGGVDHLREELGDVLLQVVLHSQIAAEEGAFTIDDVCATIDEKMIRRHPHVFGNASAANEHEVAELWEQVKLAERVDGAGTADKHLLDDVPTHFPALLQAQKISRKAVAAGFEWETLEDVWAKVAEERAELEAAYAAAPKTADGKVLHDPAPGSAMEVELEFGDLLFSLVNVARKMGIDAESALRASNAKFRRRFAVVEDGARAQERELEQLTIDEMDELWQQAKEAEA